MAKNEPTVEQLWLRPDMNLREAARATGRAYKTLIDWIEKNQVRWYREGKCIRILTASIKERSEKIAAEQSGEGQS